MPQPMPPSPTADATALPPPFVWVMGPSGAGKDSVLSWVLRHWRGPCPLRLARRSITRAASPEGELHEALSEEAFARVAAEGGFALSWAANGLRYGIRHRELAPSTPGELVLVNGSRGHWEVVRQRHPGVAVLQIWASPEVLAQRLAARGRESEAHIRERLARNAALPPIAHPRVLTVINDGELASAGRAACQGLLQWLPRD